MGKTLLLLALLPLLTFAQINSNQVKPAQQETPPSISITPDRLDFADQVVKRASKPQRLTVTNTGGKKLYINSVALSGDDQQDFTVARDTCTGATIDAQKSCVVDVIFAPTATERRKSSLIFTDNALNSPQTVQLSGNGINSADVPPRKSGR
jgi:hypothetical protein